MRRLIAGLALFLLVGACAPPTESNEPLVDPSPDLVRPGAVHLGDAPVTDRTRHLVAVAQTLYKFWNTGDASYLDRAVDDTFVDSTLPARSELRTRGSLHHR